MVAEEFAEVLKNLLAEIEKIAVILTKLAGANPTS
jgi:hypothetical protein